MGCEKTLDKKMRKPNKGFKDLKLSKFSKIRNGKSEMN